MRYCQLSGYDIIYLDAYKQSKPSMLCSIRVLIAFLSMLGTSIMYVTRVNLNIAILAMVQSADPTPLNQMGLLQSNGTGMVTATTSSSPSSSSAAALLSLVENPPMPPSPPPIPIENLIPGEFEWSPPQVGFILGSFFYGYLATQVIGGRLAEAYIPPDKLIFIALSSSGLINLMAPFLARNSIHLFVCSRILLGAFQGLVYPAFYCLFSKWIPSNERSTFIPWLDAGSIMGMILISASSGKIIIWFASFGGWPVVFYFSGALALLWSLLWICFVRSDPEDHPLITKEELLLLARDKMNGQQQQQNEQINDANNNGDDNRSASMDTKNMDINSGNNSKKVNPCWKNILSSPIFYGILLTKMSYGVVFDFVSQKIPAYLQDVIGLQVDENGLSFSLILIGYMGTLLSCGMMADTLIKHTRIKMANVRRLFQFISGSIMIISLLLIPNVGQTKWANIFLLALLMLGYGFTSGGDIPAVVDISGPLSGTVFALMNTLCSISGFTVPYLVGVVIQSAPTSIDQWRYLFIAGAIIITIGMLSFLIFNSSTLQSDWFETSANPMDMDEEKADPNMLRIKVIEVNGLLKNSLSLNSNLTRPTSFIPRYDTFPIGSL